MCASPCGELGVGTRASPMRVRPCPKQLQECKLQGSSNLNHRQVSGPSKTRRNFTSEILEKKGVGNGGNVTDVQLPLYLWPRGTWIDMVSSSAASLLTAASMVKSTPPPKSISTSGTMADWLLSPRTLATLPCEEMSKSQKARLLM